MKKIDILNFITNFRKTPNEVRTYSEIVNHLGPVHSAAIDQMLQELQQTRVIRQTELKGEKAFQVVSR